ncbi:MAG: transporter substrate-binding domain-containing protein [Burkholderiales bacterium]|nr:transporter substrate-binding domain-containing protein [Burkholderiales bacterium]
MKKSLLVATLLAVAAAAHAQTDTLKKIKDTGAVVMGVRGSSGALSYTLGEGKYVGYHVELCQRAIDDIGKQLGKKIEVKYQEVTSANRIPLVQNGTVDIECGSTTNNDARAKDVAFAHATGVDFKEVFGKDHADSFQLLESGRADAFVMDGQIVAGLASKAKNPADFHLVGEVLSVEPIAIMVRKDDPAFLAAVNKTLDGTVNLPASEATKNAWKNPNNMTTEQLAAATKK